MLQRINFFFVSVVLVSGFAMFVIPNSAEAVPIGGIEFPDGAISFADSVVSYSPGANVIAPFDEPTLALGTPDYVPGGPAPRGHLSLGWGGSVVLQFVDNSLTTSGDATADLHVFEIGPAIEPMNIFISTNSIDWIFLGELLGQPTSIDIDSIAGVVAGERYSYVRIDDADARLSGSPYGGADIDAVGAISSAPPVPTVPEPSALVLLGSALVGLAGVGRRYSKA